MANSFEFSGRIYRNVSIIIEHRGSFLWIWRLFMLEPLSHGSAFLALCLWFLYSFFFKSRLVWFSMAQGGASLKLYSYLKNHSQNDHNNWWELNDLWLPYVLCKKNFESFVHIFITFPFALRIWNWLAHILHMSVKFNSPIDIPKTANRGWSPQAKVVVSTAVYYHFQYYLIMEKRR